MTPEERQMQFVFSLRKAGVTDAAVLRAMEATDREAFVAKLFLQRALEDTALPISCGQTISAPSVVGVMTQALAVTPRSKVLELGTGSGYQAAVLSHLGRRIYTVERHKPLAQAAHEKLTSIGASNVVVLTGDGSRGLPDLAPFDRILVTAAAEDVPRPLLDQLAVGGILVMPVGAADEVQTLIKVTKDAAGLTYDEISTVRFVPLIEGLAQDTLS